MDPTPHPRRWRLRNIVFALCAVAALGLGIRHFVIPPGVAVTHIVRGESITAVYASGNVEPIVETPVAPKIMGRLAELLVDEPVQVKAGQVLARLDDQELRANLAQLQARLDLAQREAERAATLLARHTGTVQDRDKAESALQEARAAFAMADKQRSEYTLVAPGDGMITRRDGEIGQLITANQPVFTMTICAAEQCRQPLRITANVDEEDIPLVQIGQKALIHADAFPDKHFEGTVVAVTPKGNATERNFRVRIALPADHPLHIGMSTEINVIVGVQPDAWLLPASAVHDGKVWVVRDGCLQQVSIAAGPTNSGMIAVKSGLKEQDEVVIAPEENFKAGMRRRGVAPDKKA